MSDKIFSFLFVLFIGGLFLLNVFGEDARFSEPENRVLAQNPILTWSAFRTGKYTTEVEKYISDQFPFKNQFVGVKGKLDRAIGKKENNDVLFGDDGYLFERFDYEQDRLDHHLDLLNTYAEQSGMEHVYTLFPPTAIEIYPEKVPRYVTSSSQAAILDELAEKWSDKIQMINVYDTLKDKKDESIYFKTDHHWTMRAAYYAYVEAGKQMAFEPLIVDELNQEIVSQSFHGTLYSKATAYDHDPDPFELFIPKEQPKVEVTYEDGTVTHTMYELDYLDVKDKYSLFLDGNHSLVTIKTDADTGRKLAVIKDSFAHAFIPLLASHFDEIHVLDLRYYKLPITNYLEEQEIDETLFLYNLPNFVNDTNLPVLR